MAKPKAPDPVAYARVVQRDRGGRRCFTCTSKAIAPIVRKWVAMWKANETQMSVRQAHAFLRDHHGYPLTKGALVNCLTVHHGYGPHG